MNPMPDAMKQYFDDDGNPLSGGKLYSYVAGTTTPAATYTDQSGVTPHTNPVVLDAAGRAEVWMADATVYKFILNDADDNFVWGVDNISASGSGSGGGGTGALITHSVTDGQVASDLVGETLDLDNYSSALYDVEIIRGTTVVSNASLAIQDVNGTGRVLLGESLSEEDHGVTFSVSQVGSVVQLKAALTLGPGDGTIKLSRTLVAASV